MLATLTLSFGLILATTAAPPPESARTLWLVQPLYPGQELIVQKAEQALEALLPAQERGQQLIGRAELVSWLQGRRGTTACVFGQEPCREPLEAWLSSLGLETIVLVRGGQDESGFRFSAVSLRPATGERSEASASHAVLAKALTGALVKVLSLSSTLQAESTPKGATLFANGVKVGTTPLSTQILPGEHTFRFELESHLPVEVVQEVGARTQLRLERTLVKVPARLTVLARPAGTTIQVDGQQVGQDKVDQGIEPGSHTVHLAREGYLPFETSVEVKPGETLTLERDLEPTSWERFRQQAQAEQESTYGRSNAVELGYEHLTPTELFSAGGAGLYLSPLSDRKWKDFVGSNSLQLSGVGVDFINTGRNVGLLLAGLSYVQSQGGAVLQVPYEDAQQEPQLREYSVRLFSLRALQPQVRMALWRFTFLVQAGLELQVAALGDLRQLGPSEEDIPLEAALGVDLRATGQLGVRFNVLEGLFLSGSFRYGRSLLRDFNYPAYGLRAGVGYAF
jgi:hypothetical protein